MVKYNSELMFIFLECFIFIYIYIIYQLFFAIEKSKRSFYF
jgi:hypothetical protein